MFDYLRNLTKSAEEKQQEALNAYLDDSLSPQARQQFEHLLAQDPALQLEVEQRRALKVQMRQMPRRRVPRNFTLDPAVYGRPQRQPLFQLYPAMRTAAVLTAFFFILAVAADLFMVDQGDMTFSNAAPDVAMVEAVEVTRVVTETVVEEGETVEVTRVVSEEVVVEEMAAPAAVEMAEEPMAEEAAPAEEMLAAEAPEAEEPAAEEPQPAADTANESLPESTKATGEADAGAAANEDAARATTAVPTPSPVPTSVIATKSTVPRPATETVVPDRAATAVPTAQDADMLADDGQAVATAVATPTTETQSPITGLRWVQIGLGALFIVFTLAVLYVRRQSF